MPRDKGNADNKPRFLRKTVLPQHYNFIISYSSACPCFSLIFDIIEWSFGLSAPSKSGSVATWPAAASP